MSSAPTREHRCRMVRCPRCHFLNDILLVYSGQKYLSNFFVAQLQKSILWKIDTGFCSSQECVYRRTFNWTLTASLTAATANESEMYFSQKAQLSLRHGTFEGTHTFYISVDICISAILNVIRSLAWTLLCNDLVWLWLTFARWHSLSAFDLVVMLVLSVFFVLAMINHWHDASWFYM